ncbi:hypothetical protein K435DRAFT_64199 [Dendrothele bispora CBS 962.96]|uniref:Uncharacterized protein n=1 Tax=Dendrothele bispora (strain CBS 962.96) TaxID=1314807 RepID=A0A4S8KRC6_DENBC|nr:hypothetical protein K435DRAFT_64199 [Dendrothele bispora CBS 962.96]
MCTSVDLCLLSTSFSGPILQPMSKHKLTISHPDLKRRRSNNENTLPRRQTAIKAEEKPESLYVNGTEDSQINSQRWYELSFENAKAQHNPATTEETKPGSTKAIDIVEISDDDSDSGEPVKRRSLVGTQVDTVRNAIAPKSTSEVAVQTDLSGRGVGVLFSQYETIKDQLQKTNDRLQNADNNLIKADETRHNLQVKLGYAQRENNAAWSKRYMSERDQAREELAEASREKDKAIAEAEFWKTKFLRTGERMVELAKSRAM